MGLGQKKLMSGLIAGMICAWITLPAQAQQTLIKSGNAVVTAETVERIVRTTVAKTLGGTFFANELQIATKPISESIDFEEPNETFKAILTVLGLEKPLRITLAPLHINLGVPESGLKISVKAREPGIFAVHAHWEVTRFNGLSSSLQIRVPKGLYDRSFDLSASPIKVDLVKKSVPVTVDLSLEAMLTEAGTKIKLLSLKTNLNDKIQPQFHLEMGEILMNGRPLQLQLFTNGQVLTADEPSIRAQFQTIEPNVIRTIRAKLTTVIAERFHQLSEKIENREPINFKMDADELLAAQPKVDPVEKTLLSGLHADFILSYLQYVKSSQFFNAQVSSSICIDQACLAQKARDSKIDLADLKDIGGDDVAVVAYGSWLQNTFHSPEVQARFRKLIDDPNTNPGTRLGKDGIKLHLNAQTQTIDVVVNLEIDIRKTEKADADFSKRLKAVLGGTLEKMFGAGKLTLVPVQISLSWGGIREINGRNYLVLKSALPFGNDDSVINTYHYPSSVKEMTGKVRKTLLKTVHDKVKKLMVKLNKPEEQKESTHDPEILIALPKNNLTVHGFVITPKRMVITPNGGLMITGGIE